MGEFPDLPIVSDLGMPEAARDAARKRREEGRPILQHPINTYAARH